VKPPSFEYHAPRSVDEALTRLSEHGDAAKLLAGGQSLVPLLNLRLAAPEVLVDLNRLDTFAGIDACVRCASRVSTTLCATVGIVSSRPNAAAAALSELTPGTTSKSRSCATHQSICSWMAP